MAAPPQYSVDDKDLDDAALWAVIDSAAASHPASKSRKPLAIKYTNHSPPQNPNFTPPPFYRTSKNPRNHNHSYEHDSRALIEGEVVHEPSNNHYRPVKIARYCDLERSENTSPVASHLAMVKHVQQQQRVVNAPTVHSSPRLSPKGYLVSSPVSGNEKALDGRQWMQNDEKVVEPMRHSLSGQFPSVAVFKEYQNAAMAILEKGDFTMISGNPFIKKSGWRKISFYFNLSYEIKDKTIEFDESRNVQRAEFIVRASMQGGRFSDGWGSCERREKRFLKPNHDIPSTAETRAKNKACQDLLGIGEYRPGASNAQR